MRWLVEVSSLGKTDLQKFCVEAESWQRALQAARSQRGEDGPMSGFSIELLEEGYRAVDPLARVRFVVKRAPDDMPITAASPPPKDTTKKSMPPSPAVAASAPSSSAKAAAPAAPSSQPLSSDKTDPKMTPPPPPSSASNVSSSRKGIPRPGGSVPPPAPAASSSAGVTGTAAQTPEAKKKVETMNFASGGAAAVRDERPVAERPPAPAVGSQIPGLPSVKLLTAREQEPNESSPLTYREYAFAVPDGTTDEVAVDVLRAQLRLVEAHVAGAKQGKLVNLAVFDIEFTGKPPRAPLATLTWKDWKGDPVVAYPRRGNASRPPRPPDKTASGTQPASTASPSTQPTSSQSPQPASFPSPPPPEAAPVPSPPQTVPMSQTAPMVQPVAIPGPPQQPPPQVQQPAPPPPQQPPAQVQQQVQVHQVNAAVAQLAAAPHPAPVMTEAQPGKRPASVPPTGQQGMVKTPSGRFVRGRVSGDELITALFESMHDLHFLRDALDGGQFCLALATEVLPARAAIIHFFDIGRREWVVACTRGKETGRLLTMRTPEGDDFLREAARKRRALVVPNAANSTGERYRHLGGSRSLIVAPIMQAGRALGALEIINPLDGMPFTEDEGNAMTYIAEQYAEYLGSRGIILDRDRIQSAAAAH